MYKSRKINEEQEFYCLVECGCGRKFKPEDMYICYACKKIKCQYCTRIEGQQFQCKAGCSNQFTTGSKTKNIKFCCTNCLQCPLCFSTLITKVFNGKYYLSCQSCYWNSLTVHIAKGKKEEFDTYIQRMNEETCNGFLKKMYNVIVNQLSNDPIVANKNKNQLDLEERTNMDSDNDIVRKAMEEGDQNIDNFENNNSEELAKEEKKANGKCEYNDDYLNNEENKYISLKIINKLLPCCNDYNQNFNSLEEVQKAFNTNELSLNAMTGLVQRHNNPILQNPSIFNQYPKFEDLLPKKELFGKYCKECGKILVEEIEDNQKKEMRIFHSYLNNLPIIFINKIDLEQNLIKLRFILLNSTNINITFKEDPNNKVKIVLPAEMFNFEKIEETESDQKNSDFKNILVDFKFDEGYKDELASNTSHIFRFIIKAEFNRIESENQEATVSCIEYPVEIKFQIK